MEIGKQILFYRKAKGLTQERLAEIVGVSFQTVSSWENNDYLPQMDKVEDLAEALDISLVDLFKEVPVGDAGWHLKDQMFSEEHMYRFVRAWASSSGADQTMEALPFARKMHAGQKRKAKVKDKETVPYIYHPLLMACHALALDLGEDSLIATILLHDVCEDCKDEDGNSISPEDLPVGEEVKDAVRLLTKPEAWGDGWEKNYYGAIAGNRLAVITKVLDRCNNISMMATGFSREKMASYIKETETYVMPLLDVLKKKYEGQCYNAAFLIKYQMLSTIENLKRIL